MKMKVGGSKGGEWGPVVQIGTRLQDAGHTRAHPPHLRRKPHIKKKGKKMKRRSIGLCGDDPMAAATIQ